MSLTVALSSNFQLIVNNALEVYRKRTKNDLLHPLATELQNCDTPSDILAVLQHEVRGLDQSRWTKWLDPTINVFLSLRQLGQSAWCAQGHPLILDLHSCSFGRHSLPRRWSSPESAFFFQCVSSITFVWVILTYTVFRQLRRFGQSTKLF